MRVVLVTNGLGYGGAERIVEALAIDLAERGHGVAVVATTRGGPIRDNLEAKRVPVSVLHIASAVDARVPAALADIARARRADVIHSHLAVADIATAVAAPFARARTVSTVHNTGVELSRARRFAWRCALGAFDRVLCVGEAVRRSLPLDVDATVVPCSLAGARPPRLSRKEARSALGVPDEAELVLGVGRLSRVKGFDVLARALGLLDPTPRCIVIGEGEERPALEGGPLELPGAREDAADLLAAADLVVCPSRSEGLPQIQLLAMQSGVPLVATAVGGAAELVASGETGILVPPEDPRALADAMRRLLSDRPARERLAAGARDRFAERGWTREAMIAAHERIYRELLDARSKQ
jgi:glycosyltransferase involved in cell wall biosynthesis